MSDESINHSGLANLIERANDNAVSQEYSKNEPDFSYLSNLRSAFTIMHLMITCIRTMLIPLASSNVSIRREIEKITTFTMNRMEEKVNSITQRTVDVALTWAAKLLAAQKKNDFRPRDDGPGGGGAWQEMLQTPVRLLLYCYQSWMTLANINPDLPVGFYVSHAPSLPRSYCLCSIPKPYLFPHRSSSWSTHRSPGALQKVSSKRCGRPHNHQRHYQIH